MSIVQLGQLHHGQKMSTGKEYPQVKTSTGKNIHRQEYPQAKNSFSTNKRFSRLFLSLDLVRLRSFPELRIEGVYVLYTFLSFRRMWEEEVGRKEEEEGKGRGGLHVGVDRIG